jgi:hypothetical protein
VEPSTIAEALLLKTICPEELVPGNAVLGAATTIWTAPVPFPCTPAPVRVSVWLLLTSVVGPPAALVTVTSVNETVISSVVLNAPIVTVSPVVGTPVGDQLVFKLQMPLLAPT